MAFFFLPLDSSPTIPRRSSPEPAAFVSSPLREANFLSPFFPSASSFAVSASLLWMVVGFFFSGPRPSFASLTNADDLFLIDEIGFSSLLPLSPLRGGGVLFSGMSKRFPGDKNVPPSSGFLFSPSQVIKTSLFSSAVRHARPRPFWKRWPSCTLLAPSSLSLSFFLC